MKRFLAAFVLAALTLVSLATAATAGGANYRSSGLLKFRTHSSTIIGTEGANYGVDSKGGYVDSTQAYVPNAADGQDTTAVWKFPNDFCITSVTDSLPIIVVVRNSVAGAAGDTIHVGIQPFMGGDPGTNGNYLTTTAFPQVTNRVLTGAVTSGAVRLFRAGSGAAFAGAETATSGQALTTMLIPGLDLYSGFRVILYGDGTAALSNGGIMTVEILYPSCN